MRNTGLFLGAALFACASAAPALAQGCALCNTQARASGSRMIHALNEGIIVMIVPPVAFSLCIAGLAYRKRNSFRDTAAHTDDGENF
jgi:hypothetical protein